MDEKRPIPAVKLGFVLVKVHAAAINPVDYKLPMLAVNGNIVGLDFSGTIVEAGANCGDFVAGSAVFGNAPGTLCEFLLADVTKIAAKPPGLTFAEAAAVPTTYLTSYQALKEHGFESGSALLVIGASGGCGLAGVQLGRALGAKEVVAVCSGKNAELVTAHGASRVVDYTAETLRAALGPAAVDFVYDCATGSGAGEAGSPDRT